MTRCHSDVRPRTSLRSPAPPRRNASLYSSVPPTDYPTTKLSLKQYQVILTIEPCKDFVSRERGSSSRRRLQSLQGDRLRRRAAWEQLSRTRQPPANAIASDIENLIIARLARTASEPNARQSCSWPRTRSPWLAASGSTKARRGSRWVRSLSIGSPIKRI